MHPFARRTTSILSCSTSAKEKCTLLLPLLLLLLPLLPLSHLSGGHTSPAVGRALGQYLEQEWAHTYGYLSHQHRGSNQQQQARPRRIMGPQTEKEAAAAAAAGVVAANAESGAAAGEADGASSSSRQPTALKINTSGQKGKYGVRIVHACLAACQSGQAGVL
jgi:hypothetical protein